jgi:hypothetical protein
VYARKYFGSEAIVIFNNSNKPQDIKVTLPNVLKAVDMKAFNGNAFVLKNRELSLKMPAYGVEIVYK